MPEETLEYWKAQTKAQLDINSDWRKRCQSLEKELAEAKERVRELTEALQDIASDETAYLEGVIDIAREALGDD